MKYAMSCTPVLARMHGFPFITHPPHLNPCRQLAGNACRAGASGGHEPRAGESIFYIRYIGTGLCILATLVPVHQLLYCMKYGTCWCEGRCAYVCPPLSGWLHAGAECGRVYIPAKQLLQGLHAAAEGMKVRILFAATIGVHAHAVCTVPGSVELSRLRTCATVYSVWPRHTYSRICKLF